MPLGCTNFAAILFVSYVITEITDTVYGHDEQAACSLADVGPNSQPSTMFRWPTCVGSNWRYVRITHNWYRQFKSSHVSLTRHLNNNCSFESAIDSSYPGWYRNGMEFFTYAYNGYQWRKRTVTWGIVKESSVVDTGLVLGICEDSFKAWNRDFIYVLKKAKPGVKPDIRISFESGLESGKLSTTRLPPNKESFNEEGADIVINDTINWTKICDDGYNSLPHTIFHEIGHALGLGNSPDFDAVMHENYPHERTARIYVLNFDDRLGIRERYGMSPIAFEGTIPLERLSPLEPPAEYRRRFR